MKQSRDFILSRSRVSPRVQDLLAVAIQVTSFRILNYRVSIDQARQWARNRTVREVLEELRHQLQIKRITKYGPISEEQQHDLVDYEMTLITLETPGVRIDKVEKRRVAIRRFEEIKREEQREGRRRREIKQIVKRVGTKSQNLRRFLRRAERLWVKQRNRVRREVFDGRIQNETIDALHRIHGRYCEEAVKVLRE